MSFLYKRPGSPYWYYGWLDESGTQRGVSLKVRTRIEAEIRQRTEDAKRSGSGEIIEGITWMAFKKEFLVEYRDRTLRIYMDTFQVFESLAHPSTVSAFTYNDAKAYKAALRAYVSPATKRPLKDNTVNIHL